MKCQNCGAEIQVGELNCSFCGAMVTYDMIRQVEQINKSGCPRCFSKNITFNREKRGEYRGKTGTSVLRSTVGFCKDCGYTWTAAGNNQANNNDNKLLIWIVGWFLCFPIPLFLILRKHKDKLNKKAYYGIIIASIILYFIIFMSMGSSGRDKAYDNANIPSEREILSEIYEEKASDYPLQKSFEEKYGPISFFESVPNDKTSKWRLALYSSNVSQIDFAKDYYETFFKNDSEIHCVINKTKQTTARFIHSLDGVNVTIFRYVINEEKDATIMFTGEILQQEYISFEESGNEGEKTDNGLSDMYSDIDFTTNKIELIADEQGEYGRPYTLNEETQIVYYIPSGNYLVKNIGQYMTQVSSYSPETQKQGEWDEPADSIQPILLEVNEIKPITINEGWYIEIHEPTHIVLVPDNITSSNTNKNLTADTFVEEIKTTIADKIGNGEIITDVKFIGRNLFIFVDISNANVDYGLDLLAISRTSDITDGILDLDSAYDSLWNTITVDFGNVGKITNSKSDLRNGPLGRYFEFPEDRLVK